MVIRDDMECVRAAARLTALESGSRILIGSNEAALRAARRIEPTSEELAAAAAREAARREAWGTYCLDVDVHLSEWSRRAGRC